MSHADLDQPKEAKARLDELEAFLKEKPVAHTERVAQFLEEARAK